MITCDWPVGAPFPCGTNRITCCAVDDAGNRACCTYRVIVICPTQTQIICPPDRVVSCTQSNGAFAASFVVDPRRTDRALNVESQNRVWPV